MRLDAEQPAVAKCRGKKRNRQPCKNPGKYGGYCYAHTKQHAAQAAKDKGTVNFLPDSPRA